MDVIDLQFEPGHEDRFAEGLLAVREQQPDWRGLVFVHDPRCRFSEDRWCDCHPDIADLRVIITH